MNRIRLTTETNALARPFFVMQKPSQLIAL